MFQNFLLNWVGGRGLIIKAKCASRMVKGGKTTQETQVASIDTLIIALKLR